MAEVCFEGLSKINISKHTYYFILGETHCQLVSNLIHNLLSTGQKVLNDHMSVLEVGGGSFLIALDLSGQRISLC